MLLGFDKIFTASKKFPILFMNAYLLDLGDTLVNIQNMFWDMP